MTDYLKREPLTVVLVSLGLLMVAATYGALYVSHREKRFVSGVPFVGGALIAVGFLLSSHKLLALTCLIDYGVWMLPKIIIEIKLDEARLRRTYAPLLRDFVREKSDLKLIYVYVGEYTYNFEFITSAPYRVPGTRAVFSLCKDRDRGILLFLDYDGSGRGEFIPFGEGRHRTVIEDKDVIFRVGRPGETYDTIMKKRLAP